VLAVAALTSGNFELLGQHRESPRAETYISAPEKARFDFTSENGPMALSHDGKRLAFIATFAGKNMIWVRSLGSDAAQQIEGTEGAHYPFWSPDGRYLGFFSDGKLKKIATASDAPPQTLCDAPKSYGGTWNADDTIVFSPRAHDSLVRVSAGVGTPARATRLDEKAGEYSHRFPWFLPDGRHFLYLLRSSKGANDSRIYAGSLDSNEKKVIISANSPAMYSDGYLLFLRGLTLMAQRFDTKRLRVLADAQTIGSDIQYFPNTASAIFAVADDGTLAYHTGPGRLSRLVWVDRSGKEVGEIASVSSKANVQLPRIGHGGDRIVYYISDPHSGADSLWIYDVASDVSTRFTVEPGDALWPAWSPDDSRIAYSVQQQGHVDVDIFVKLSSGAAPASPLYSSPAIKFVNDWSRDGRYILFQQMEGQSKTGWDICLLDVQKKTAAAVIQTQFNETGAIFSPDGKWIVWASDVSGRNELYAQPFPGPGPSVQITTNGGSEPQWGDDGKRIFFRDGDDAMCRVDVETVPTLRASKPVALFPLRARWLNIGGRQWQATGDGQRFLLDELIPEGAPAPITVIMNWAQQLKK
jgi:Tol biopolymer transport system component